MESGLQLSSEFPEASETRLADNGPPFQAVDSDAAGGGGVSPPSAGGQ